MGRIDWRCIHILWFLIVIPMICRWWYSASISRRNRGTVIVIIAQGKWIWPWVYGSAGRNCCIVINDTGVFRGLWCLIRFTFVESKFKTELGFSYILHSNVIDVLVFTLSETIGQDLQHPLWHDVFAVNRPWHYFYLLQSNHFSLLDCNTKFVKWLYPVPEALQNNT